MPERSKKDLFKKFDTMDYFYDREGDPIDREDFKDRAYQRWLYKATRTLQRIPEYEWLFSEKGSGWLTVEQVAEAMQVSKKTVYSWCKDIIGARPAEGKGGYRIPRSGLIIFLADLDEEPPEMTSEAIEAQMDGTAASSDDDEEPPDLPAEEYIANLEDYTDEEED